MKESDLKVKPSEWGGYCHDKNNEFLLDAGSSIAKDMFRVMRISWEIMKGFSMFRKLGPCVTVYGSARFNEDNGFYSLSRTLGFGLAKAGFTVLTGGGPGLMEAANRGAKDACGLSIGCNIKLPKEQVPNQYLDKFLEFKYFLSRKLILAKYSYAFIAMPGGFGTLDEMFEVITLIQTGKMKKFPIIFIGIEYWKPLLEFIKTTLMQKGAISQNDLDLIVLTDSPAEAVSLIKEVGISKFGLAYAKG